MQEALECYADNSEENLLERLPLELLLMIIQLLMINDLSLFRLVNRYYHAISETIFWPRRCLEYSHSAIEFVKHHYQLVTWKAIYQRITASTQEACIRLENYYLDCAKQDEFITGKQGIERFCSDRVDPKFLKIFKQLLEKNEEQKKQVTLFFQAMILHDWIEPWLRNPTEKDIKQFMQDNPLQACLTFLDEKYTIIRHHCQLFAAAATGNTALILSLLDKMEPSLNDLFYVNFGESQRITSQQHPLSSFPIRYGLIGLEIEEAKLVQFARFYQQQVVLDKYYQIAKRLAPENQWLIWAIICHQPLSTIETLITSEQKLQEKLTCGLQFHRVYRYFTPLYLAVFFNDIEVLRLMIQKGANLKALPYNSQKMLIHIPISNNDHAILSELMHYGVRYTGINNKLLYAIMDGDLSSLLEYHYTRPSYKTDALNAAWNIALRHNDIQKIYALLDAYPFLESNLFHRDDFHEAALQQNTALVDLTVRLALAKPEQHPWLLDVLIQQALYFNNRSPLLAALDAGIRLTNLSEPTLRLWIKEATLVNNATARKEIQNILLCELKIQQALAKKPWVNALYSFFFRPPLYIDLMDASKLEPIYFTRRVEQLLDHPAAEWDKQVIQALQVCLGQIDEKAPWAYYF